VARIKKLTIPWRDTRDGASRWTASDAGNPCGDLLRDLYDARGAAISHLYETRADNARMKTITHLYRSIGWRTAGMTLSALLFALSIAELIWRPGMDAAMWRGLALSSLYLRMCLSQRRLFTPARMHDHRRGHW
jgi:hypothetical protein